MDENKPLLKATARTMDHANLIRQGAEREARAQAYREEAAAKKLMPKPPKPIKPRKVWDNHIHIADVLKSDKLKIVVSAVTRSGSRCVDIREFYRRNESEEWLPSRNGIVIPIINPYKKTRKPDPDNPPVMLYPMRDLMPAFTRAVEVAENMELSDPANAVYAKPKKEKQNEDK